MAKKLVIEHPAMFLGESRADLVRISAVDESTGKRYKIKVRGDENDNGCSETLVPYPAENEYDITDEEC